MKFPSLPEVDRRGLMRLAGAGGAIAGTSALLTSCGLRGSSTTDADVLKIGLVSPQTGPLASFAAPDDFVIERITEALRDGITAGGRTRRIEVVVKDTQSNPTRASDVTQELISQDQVDIVIASGTPDTANPVSDRCEANGVPNVTTIVPWESWYYGRGGEPGGEGFKYSTNFYCGLSDMSDTHIAMFKQMDVTSDAVAGLWPDDTDGNAFRDGFGSALVENGYEVIDGGLYQNGATDFSPQIARFKNADAQLFNTIPVPPDFQTFWRQAKQQNFLPKLATSVRAMLFPSEAEALGEYAHNVGVLGWWLPTFPYESSIDGTTPLELTQQFTEATGQQWSQALGSLYSLFEVCVEAFQNADDPKDKEDVAHQLRNLKYQGISGPLDFTTGPEVGIAVQKGVGVQWRPSDEFEWDLVVVDNTYLPEVPLGGEVEPTNP